MTHPAISVTESSQVGAVRRGATQLATEAGFGALDTGRVALVATEMATNLAKHGREGVMLLQVTGRAPAPAVELLALDRGPGIADVARAMQDGTSTAGSPGTGLGAIRRSADRFDVYSTGTGTAVFAALAATTPAASARFDVGSVCAPHPGEEVSGDGFAIRQSGGRAWVLVVDGLGHGPLAAAASARAVEVFDAQSPLDPVGLMQRLHDALRPTRGAAAALAEVDAGRGIVRYCGVGNIAATILAGGMTRSLVSHHGTLGHDARRFAEFQYPWTADAMLVLNSDGLVSSWTLAKYPGLAERAPALIAGILYRDFRRHRDDTTVVVLRGNA